MITAYIHSSVDWRPKYQLRANVILNAEKNLREERKAGLITNPTPDIFVAWADLI